MQKEIVSVKMNCSRQNAKKKVKQPEMKQICSTFIQCRNWQPSAVENIFSINYSSPGWGKISRGCMCWTLSFLLHVVWFHKDPSPKRSAHRSSLQLGSDFIKASRLGFDGWWTLWFYWGSHPALSLLPVPDLTQSVPDSQPSCPCCMSLIFSQAQVSRATYVMGNMKGLTFNRWRVNKTQWHKYWALNFFFCACPYNVQ